MTREEVKVMLPVLQAFADGKTIESRCIKGDKSLWYDDEDPSFDNDLEYRIKPEYRPFKNTEECFEEMQKHQPSGWIKRNGYYYNIIAIGVISVTIIGTEGNIARLNYSDLLSHYNFIDGTLIGIRKEE